MGILWGNNWLKIYLQQHLPLQEGQDLQGIRRDPLREMRCMRLAEEMQGAAAEN